MKIPKHHLYCSVILLLLNHIMYPPVCLSHSSIPPLLCWANSEWRISEDKETSWSRLLLKTTTGGRLLFSQQEKKLMPRQRLLSQIAYAFHSFMPKYGLLSRDEQLNKIYHLTKSDGWMEAEVVGKHGDACKDMKYIHRKRHYCFVPSA